MKMKVSKPKQRKSSKKKKKKKSKNSKKQASDSQLAYAMPSDYNAQPRSQVFASPQFMASRQGYQQQPSFLNFASPIPASSMGNQMEAFDPSMMYGQMNGQMNGYQQQQQQNAYGNQMMMLSKMMKIPQIVIKVPAPIVNVPTPIVNVSLIDSQILHPMKSYPQTCHDRK